MKPSSKAAQIMEMAVLRSHCKLAGIDPETFARWITSKIYEGRTPVVSSRNPDQYVDGYGLILLGLENMPYPGDEAARSRTHLSPSAYVIPVLDDASS